jgi:AraC-like DNA-binding protein
MRPVDQHHPLDPRALTMSREELRRKLNETRGTERLRWVADRVIAQSLYELAGAIEKRRDV